MSTVFRARLFASGALLALAGCGGGAADVAVPQTTAPGTPSSPGVASTSLTGAVAVGVPMTQGRVRVLDASGAVVAQDVAVGDDGSYSVPQLTGEGPYRIEACGYVGAQFQCIYSVAQGAGTANVTPLTTAAVLLAADQQPGALMNGAANGLGSSAMANAQGQLRTGLAGLMNGNVPAGFDFISGELQAGSRSGYDRLLDAIGVSTGEDDGAFVQITPRLGSGNLYLEPGTISGSVAADVQAGTLPLAQIDALFTRMTAAVASEATCLDPAHGLVTEVASDARMDMDGGMTTGAQQVAEGICGFFGQSGMWGAHFLHPTLGRCDTLRPEPRCIVGFDLKLADGSVMAVGNDMGVELQGGMWKFLGSFLPLSVHIDARAQRQARIDNPALPAVYERAIAIDVPALAQLQCVKASQPAEGGLRVFAVLKNAGNAERLSVWRDTVGGEPSLDPAVGAIRSSDDTWLMLPQGAQGDEVVRNFFHNGRTVTLALFQDANCTQPLALEGASTLEVDVEGVPPVWAAMPNLPWPELTAPSAAAVLGLSLAANAGAELQLGWTFPRGRSGVNGVMFCSGLDACGDQQPGRLGEREVSPSASSTTLPVTAGAQPTSVRRMLSLYGSGPGGIGLQTNFVACGGAQSCFGPN